MRAALALLVAAAGCAGDGVDCAELEPGTAEVGLGDLATGFAPMADGAEVAIVLGPQGLNMIVVSLRARGLAPTADDAYQVGVGVDHDGALVAGTVGVLEPAPGDGDTADFLGLRVVFTVAEVRPLDGVTAEITATVTDGCGRQVQARRSVRLAL